MELVVAIVGVLLTAIQVYQDARRGPGQRNRGSGQASGSAGNTGVPYGTAVMLSSGSALTGVTAANFADLEWRTRVLFLLSSFVLAWFGFFQIPRDPPAEGAQPSSRGEDAAFIALFIFVMLGVLTLIGYLGLWLAPGYAVGFVVLIILTSLITFAIDDFLGIYVQFIGGSLAAGFCLAHNLGPDRLLFSITGGFLIAAVVITPVLRSRL